MSFKNKMVPKIYSWSPSRLGAYENCPASAKYKYIEKLPEPPSPTLDRGIEIHKGAEDYVTHRTRKLHEDLQNPKVKKLLGVLRKDYKLKKVRVELELAFTREWKPCHWLAKDVYVRFKLDVLHLRPGKSALVIDWKTGKFKPDGEYDQQLSAYAVGALSSGLVESVTAQLVFTDCGEVVERPAGTLTLKDLPKAQKLWDKKAKAMLSDTRFAPRPGNSCRWCPFSTNRGGPCKF